MRLPGPPYARAVTMMIIALSAGLLVVTGDSGLVPSSLVFPSFLIGLTAVIFGTLTRCPNCNKRVMRIERAPGAGSREAMWPERICSKCGADLSIQRT